MLQWWTTKYTNTELEEIVLTDRHNSNHSQDTWQFDGGDRQCTGPWSPDTLRMGSISAVGEWMK